MTDKQRQKMDLMALAHATEVVKLGGVLEMIHVKKPKIAKQQKRKTIKEK